MFPLSFLQIAKQSTVTHKPFILYQILPACAKPETNHKLFYLGIDLAGIYYALTADPEVTLLLHSVH